MKEIKLYPIEESEALLVVDFSNLCFASFYSQFAQEDLNKTVYIALRKILSWLGDFADDKKTTLIFALDNFPQHKRDLVPSYKTNRKEKIVDPRPTVKKILKNTNCYFAEAKANEADDVIASILHIYKERFALLVSTDHDLLQLKTPNVEIMHLSTGQLFTKQKLIDKYGINTWKKVAIFKALFGDTSDAIKPSLKRVRKKDILPVINKCDGTLKGFIQTFKKSKQSPKTKQVFKENLQNLRNNYKIVKLNRKLEVSLIKNTPNKPELKKALKRVNIYSLKSKMKSLL